MTKVIGYRRLSPTGVSKSERKSKLRKQKDKIEEHCEEEDKELVEMFTATRASARTKLPMEREVWQDMVEFLVENPDVEEVIVHHFDRTTRIAVVGLALKEYLGAGIWQPGKEYREVEIYSTQHEEYFKSKTDLENTSAGDLFGGLADFYQGQASKKDEADKSQEALDEKVVKGKPPRGLTTDKRLAEHADIALGEASRYLPCEQPSVHRTGVDEEDAEIYTFSTAVEVCHRVHNGNPKTDVGRTLGFPEGQEWNHVHRIWKNRHKYVMAMLWHRELQEDGPPEWYDNDRSYDFDYGWLDDADISELEKEVLEDKGRLTQLPWRGTDREPEFAEP